MNIILFGAQGSGKGTQSAMLAQALGIRHVASGDLFRQAVEEQTEPGKIAQKYLDAGELVPDDVTVALVLGRIRQSDCMPGVLLDGFPRTLPQAYALDEGLLHIGREITAALYLKVPREELLRRLSGRYICRARQHVYNVVTRPPKVPGICDIDGSELYQRSDDRGDAVTKRLNTFFNQTIRLINHYEQQHKLLEIDGNRSIGQVHQDLVAAVRQQKDK